MSKTKKAPKSKSRTFFSYDDENLQDAIKAVKENGMSKKKAARLFGVPRSTLIRKLSGQVPLVRKMGPKTELSEVEEDMLANWIIAMARKGFPVHKGNLAVTVQKMLKETGREARYVTNDGLPGRSWFESFLKRHSNIKQKHTESVSKARAAVTQDRLGNWFDEISMFLKDEGFDHILQDPGRIFNGDEAGFKLCPKSGKVLGPANNPNEDFYERVSSEKEQITVMATFAANGKYVPPMIIFPYKKMPKAIVESVPSNYGLGRSDSGWMNSEVFYEYIANHLIPYIKAENITRPVIFFVDGHKSHMTKQVSELCDEHGIILIALFPNATHIIQPADVAVFKPLKAGWTSAVRNWKFENFPKEVTRFTFGSILSSVFEKYATETTIQNGFRKCGLYPFDKENVDYSKCIPNRKIETVISNAPAHERTSLNEALRLKLEEMIDTDELKEFSETYSQRREWAGSRESLNLYKVWAAMKTQCDSGKTKDPNPEGVEEQENKKPEIETTEMPNDGEEEPELLEQNRDEIYIDHRSPEPQPSCSWQTPEDCNIHLYEKKESEGYKIPSPFKKCLVFPRTPEKRAPKRRIAVYPAVVSSAKYREFYEQQKLKKTTPKSKKKIERLATTTAHVINSSESEDALCGNEDLEQTLEEITPKSKKKSLIDDTSSSESEIDVPYDDEDMDISEPEVLCLEVGKHVIVKYENEYYPGLILKKDDEGADVKSMKKSGFDWKWPSKDDVLYYLKEDVVSTIGDPQLKNKRGLYSVPEMIKYQ